MLNRLVDLGLATVVVTALFGHGIARAQDEGEEEEAGAAAQDEAAEPGAAPAESGDEADDAAAGSAAADAGTGAMHVTMGKGKINIDVALELMLSDGAVLDVVGISPDLWYGVTDSLDIGVVHSTMNTGGFVGALAGSEGVTAPSLCVTGDICDVADIYHNVGLEGRYGIKNGTPLAFGVNGGAYALDFDPDFLLALKLGVFGHYVAGNIMIGFAPNIFIGLTERSSGNEERLHLPILAVYQVVPQLGIGLQTGLAATFDQFGDFFQIPLSLGAQYMATAQLGLGAAFTLPAVLAGDQVGQDGVNGRVLTVWANYTIGGGG
jgi:hypothetical protein